MAKVISLEDYRRKKALEDSESDEVSVAREDLHESVCRIIAEGLQMPRERFDVLLEAASDANDLLNEDEPVTLKHVTEFCRRTPNLLSWEVAMVYLLAKMIEPRPYPELEDEGDQPDAS